MTNRKAVGIIAGVVLLIGLVLLFVPTSVSGGADPVGCGNALSGGTDIGDEFREQLEDIYSGGTGELDLDSQCADRLMTQRLIAWPIAGVGAAVLGFLALTGSATGARPVHRQDESPAPEPETERPAAP